MKKILPGLALASLLFTTGSAVAADYKIDKEGQHAFVSSTLVTAGYTVRLRTSTVALPLMRPTRRPIK